MSGSALCASNRSFRQILAEFTMAPSGGSQYSDRQRVYPVVRW